jgi:hypothetical protein
MYGLAAGCQPVVANAFDCTGCLARDSGEAAIFVCVTPWQFTIFPPYCKTEFLLYLHSFGALVLQSPCYGFANDKQTE